MESESEPSGPPVILPNVFVHRHNMGKGLVAKNRIKAGTQILIEKPLFVAPASFYFKPSTAAAERLVKQHIESHNSTDQAAWGILSNYHPFAEYQQDGLSTGKFFKTHYIGKFKTAAIPIPLGARRRKADYFGIFPLLSWANHACHHNAHHAWNESLNAITVYALSDIAANEQITISYAPANVINRDLIKRTYGFTCYCDWCMQRSEDRQATDERYHKLEDWSMRVHREKDVGKALWLVNCALTLMLEQPPVKDYRLGMLFADAFDIALDMGDYLRASILAYKACQAFVNCEGVMSDAVARVRNALGELMRKVEGLDAGKAVDQGVGGKGKGKAVDDAKDEDVGLPEGLRAWLGQRNAVWEEKKEAQGNVAFEWLFMSELWPETD